MKFLTSPLPITYERGWENVQFLNGSFKNEGCHCLWDVFVTDILDVSKGRKEINKNEAILRVSLYLSVIHNVNITPKMAGTIDKKLPLASEKSRHAGRYQMIPQKSIRLYLHFGYITVMY